MLKKNNIPTFIKDMVKKFKLEKMYNNLVLKEYLSLDDLNTEESIKVLTTDRYEYETLKLQVFLAKKISCNVYKRNTLVQELN